MTIGLFFLILAVLLVIAMPVGGVFGLLAVLPSLMGTISFAPMDVVRSMFSGMNSFTLLAVPLFMVSGMIMAEGGLSERLFNFFGYFIGNKTAGFPCAVVVTCMFYAAISGSAPATVSAVGAMTIPFLTNMGYDLIFSTAIVTVAGGLGVIIPPSISYIVYSAAATASPSKLFIAGIVPGIMIGFALMVYCFIYCKKNGEDKEKLMASYNELHAKGFFPLLKESFWALLTPVIILGCIYSGICSPTEAAVISVIYGLLVCIFAYRTIRIKDIGKVFVSGAKTYVNILFVIAAASAFARAMTLLRYPQTISSAVLALTDNKIIILLLMNLIMLVCGMIIDNIPNIMILTPILLPIATSIGIDPIHFGIIMTANLAIGMITPPMGINLFVASGMTKIPMLKLSKATMPFLEAFLVCLMVITFVPQVSMFAVGGSSSTSASSSGSDYGIEATADDVDYGEYNWTAAMTVADTTTNYKMVEYFAKMINQKSGGSINVDIYPGGQLGNTTEFTEAVIGGSIDIGTGMTTDMVDFVPEMALFDMPNLFDNVEQMRALLQSDYKDVINGYTEANGIHMLGFSDAGFRQLTTNKKVENLDDLAGQKIRVMTNEYHIAYWNELGAAATPMQFNEVFMGLQQNTIDGEENPYMNIVGNNLQEVQKYIVETNHIGHIITFFMNDDLYDSLPEQTQALVDECAAAAVEYASGVADEEIEADKQTCIDAGCEIINLSDEDHATLKEKAQTVWNMVRENLGDEKVDTLLDALNNLDLSDTTAVNSAPDIDSLEATGENYGDYNWTAAMTVAETTTNYKMVEYFAQAINKLSGGSINIDLYPGGQLGNTTEFTEAVIGGSIDIGTGMTTDMVDFVPEMALFDMPNLFDDVSQMRSLLQSDYVDTLNSYTEANGIHMMGFSDAGFRQLTTNKKVEKLDDLAGQKIRVMTNEYHIAYWNELGAAATPMQFNEVFMGLQQNTIDGEENPYMNIVGNNLQEVQKYIVETNHIGHIITFFMNEDLYNSLPENTRALVDQCAEYAVQYASGVADEEIETDKQTCIDAGCEIITLSDEDYATLKEKAQTVWDMVRKNLGDEKVDTLLDALDKAR